MCELEGRRLTKFSKTMLSKLSDLFLRAKDLTIRSAEIGSAGRLPWCESSGLCVDLMQVMPFRASSSLIIASRMSFLLVCLACCSRSLLELCPLPPCA